MSEAEIAGFIGKFAPPMQGFIEAARAAMRRRFPAAVELVYDNYNFLVFGYGPTERASECPFSLAAHAKGVSLNFLHGSMLRDSEGLLRGSGTKNRHVRLQSAATLSDPRVEALLQQAVELCRPPMPASGHGYSVVKSVSAKQRPRQ